MQLRLRLEVAGYEVLEANDGEEALKKAKSEKPDLILLDVMMPPPNGFQVCRELKDDPEYRGIPIVMLTAKTAESDQFWGAESGADAYVTKPYSGANLVEKVNNILST